jgi:DNA-binding NarL/FixJ family response regulator
MANELRIGLLDGDSGIRAGRRLVLDSQRDFKVVYEEENALVALERIPDLLIDVLVIDHRLKALDGIEFSRRLVEVLTSAEHPVPKIVITGPYHSRELEIAAIRSGASAVATQDMGPEALLKAIREVAQSLGEPDFEFLLQFLNEADAIHLGSQVFLMRLGDLSEKEQAVLDLFEATTPFEQIAESLEIPRYRVRQIFEKVMRRCGLATRAQLFLALFEAGQNRA